MKNLARIIGLIAALVLGVAVPSTFAGNPSDGGYSPEMQSKIEEVKKELKKFTDEKALVENNLKTFDELDFVVFSNQ